MTPKRFYDWQTGGGADDVLRLVEVLERADVAWCVVGESRSTIGHDSRW